MKSVLIDQHAVENQAPDKRRPPAARGPALWAIIAILPVLAACLPNADRPDPALDVPDS